MNYKEGDRVRIKSLGWYNKNRSRSHGTVACGGKYFDYDMREWCGKTMTILTAYQTCYTMREDGAKNLWTDEMIECKVEEEAQPKFKVGDKVITDKGYIGKFEGWVSDYQVRVLFEESGCNVVMHPKDLKLMEEETSTKLTGKAIESNEMAIGVDMTGVIEEAKTYWDSIKDAWICPEGYVFKDENGNRINAQKIVLEKKKKDVSLTQEQINTMVHDSCVLFCKHCGCGIPRETCTSLGTCKEHDEYRNAIRTHLLGKKEKGYPKTYEECCRVLGFDEFMYTNTPTNNWYKWKQFHALNRLFICRDAYWKVAGEEMGLGKPWNPNWHDDEKKYTIEYYDGEIIKDSSLLENRIFSFPTPEMRDAFKENFDKDIETCKEFL